MQEMGIVWENKWAAAIAEWWFYAAAAVGTRTAIATDASSRMCSPPGVLSQPVTTTSVTRDRTKLILTYLYITDHEVLLRLVSVPSSLLFVECIVLEATA